MASLFFIHEAVVTLLIFLSLLNTNSAAAAVALDLPVRMFHQEKETRPPVFVKQMVSATLSLSIS